MQRKRDHYFSNTETLADNKFRVVALGTGRSFLRSAQSKRRLVDRTG